MNNFELTSNYIDTSDEDYVEAGHYFTILDASHLMDNMGTLEFLREVVRTMNNPIEQHLATQLLLIAEKHQRVLYSMRRADEVLYAVNKDGVGENV